MVKISTKRKIYIPGENKRQFFFFKFSFVFSLGTSEDRYCQKRRYAVELQKEDRVLDNIDVVNVSCPVYLLVTRD